MLYKVNHKKLIAKSNFTMWAVTLIKMDHPFVITICLATTVMANLPKYCCIKVLASYDTEAFARPGLACGNQ